MRVKRGGVFPSLFLSHLREFVSLRRWELMSVKQLLVGIKVSVSLGTVQVDTHVLSHIEFSIN